MSPSQDPDVKSRRMHDSAVHPPGEQRHDYTFDLPRYLAEETLEEIGIHRCNLARLFSHTIDVLRMRVVSVLPENVGNYPQYRKIRNWFICPSLRPLSVDPRGALSL
jgi:hypothetical protein